MRFFYGRLQFPQVFITFFLLLLLIVATTQGIPLTSVISDALVRLPMNGILVLALAPMLKAGIGINFGLPVGIAAGLLGMCLSVNFKCAGLWGFWAAMVAAVPPALLFGWIYSLILNRAAGSAEITATFVGFAFVPLMNFFWASAPFTNRAMLWPIGGNGLRPTIGLKSYFGKALNTLWAFQVGEVTIPLGMLFFFAASSFLLYLFFKTRLGRAMTAVGENEEFVRLAGLDISKIRRIAIVLSTLIGAFGICVYAQSFGFIELYDAPLMMAFPAASAILVGGGMGRATTIFHVILGTFLFQTLYVVSGPIANEAMIPEVAEILRLMLTNGVILYALLHEGRRSHEC